MIPAELTEALHTLWSQETVVIAAWTFGKPFQTPSLELTKYALMPFFDKQNPQLDLMKCKQDLDSVRQENQEYGPVEPLFLSFSV